MDTLALALLAFFVSGWFVLAGADIGTGMLLPYLGRDSGERRLVIASFAPFFLGNEVWLVATAGLLAGCFPELEGALLTGQFPVLLPLLAGWIVRDLGLWTRGRGPGRRWRALCDGAVTAGSWSLALSAGWLLAALLTGRPYEPARRARRRPHRPRGGRPVRRPRARLRLAAPDGRAVRAHPAARRAGRPPWHPFALTAVLLGGLPLAAGGTLAPGSYTADPATLRLLVPAVLAVTAGTVAVQAWIWRLFRHRVTGPSYL
ncbi:cytochrome d ubiquinol oxidase subunit II [Streptomyces roseicoloratus]|uniref:Cytochrome d ubiquinol oxidase subunit II n=1 Tax=Streptomyces roseicoloratus TaxID=2508722 RepID=A0ABY9RRB2_9ACTN|nr:cytochrome d ubiquinol oxidase subunit II [Streptomyces roseicoloratus]WMX44724.1 cytochrome d ubiquinol oxidase subunit II [Streptomyces roseicoloratus]